MRITERCAEIPNQAASLSVASPDDHLAHGIQTPKNPIKRIVAIIAGQTLFDSVQCSTAFFHVVIDHHKTQVVLPFEMMTERAAGHLGSLDDFVHLGVMKSLQRKHPRRLTQNSIACLDRAGLFRGPHMALQNKQITWYVFMLVTLIGVYKSLGYGSFPCNVRRLRLVRSTAAEAPERRLKAMMNMQKGLVCVAALLAGQSAWAQQNSSREALTSGDYHVTQSWSQEESYKRPFHVRVPDVEDKPRRLPVLIFLHGNGASAREAMRGFIRGRGTIASRYVMVFPQGYRESWNIVSERSKADDLRFIEAIVLKLATFENVDPNNFTIMGASNGAAMVNQLAIESKLPSIRNYISGVSQLNVWQYDGEHFKAKGDDNNYRTVASPAKGKRLLNISGVSDKLVPYHGGPSKVIPAKAGKLAFVDAELSTFLWARQMGYDGEQLLRPTRTIQNAEVFRYLDGDVVHYKVMGEGHGATHGISEKLLLDFLDQGERNDASHRSPAVNEPDADEPAANAVPLTEDTIEDEVNEETKELNERIKETQREQRRFKRLGVLMDQQLKLLRELKKLHVTIAAAEKGIDDAKDEEQQIERLEKTLQESEVRMEVTNIRLEILERRMGLEELSFEIPPEQNELANEADSLLKMLDAGERLVLRFTKVWLEEDEETAEELEGEFEQMERVFERRREILHLRFELLEAHEEGGEEWIRELEVELEEMGADGRDEQKNPNNAALNLPVSIQLTNVEINAAAKLDFDTEILPRLKSACFDCHDSGDASGDLDLEQLVTQRPLVINRTHWMNVIEQIKVRSMPPADAEQPSDEDRRALLGWLTDRIDNFDYTTVRRSGVVPAKRLTHDEYNNTVRDLVGIDLRPADRFPTDLTASSGFENSANSLFIQPVTLERYVGAAEAIVQAAWPLEPTSIEQQSALKRLFGGVSDLDEDSAQRVVVQFATRAYRRPLEQDEIDSLTMHYRRRRSQGDSVEIAIREVLQVILISPNFLIRSEAAPEFSTEPTALAAGSEDARKHSVVPEASANGSQAREVPVSDWELASRLSYFLWASMPDDELFELARDGRLHEPTVIAQQVDRMLADSKSASLGSLFAAQWLGFAELDRVQRDQIDNPWATDSLVQAMKSESALLFHSLVRRNASIDRLLDADFTFINEELANHYRIEGVSGSEMREVSLRETPRRGVLGHGSILATTSLPRRTSPVMRGNWILATLLGTPPPPPPPNASEFNERLAENERLSQRQKLDLHRTNPNCYACHSQIDPLGFALEEFEWFGRYRPERGGRPVDSVGKLPDGTEFRGLMGLSSTLVSERSSDLAEQLTRKMLAYALGRQLEYYDEATVRELATELAADGRRLQTLIHAIVRSDSFQKKQW